MYLIKWRNEVVAYQEGEIFRVIDPHKAPWELFGGHLTVTTDLFLDWITQRVFPPDRIGADELLEEMGMKDYDPVQIAYTTNAILTGVDPYSIEWVESFNKEDSKGSG